MLFLQNSEDVSLSTINTKINALQDAYINFNKEYLEVIRDVREISRDNKSIIARLSNIETALTKSGDISNLIKEVNDIKTKVSFGAVEEILTKVEKLSESNEENNKAFTFIKNSQTKLEMKTIKMEKDIETFKSEQEYKASVVNKGLEEFKLEQELNRKEFIKESQQLRKNEIKEISCMSNKYANSLNSNGKVFINKEIVNLNQLSEAIKDCNTITNLILVDNKLGDSGVEVLSEALKYSTSINSIVIQYNEIGTKGAKYISEALKINKSITLLNLDNNQILDAGADYLYAALSVNKSISSISFEFNNVNYNKKANLEKYAKSRR